MGCGSLKRGATYDCTNPLQGGAEPNVTLLNFDEVAGTTTAVSPENLITALILANGASGYQFQGFGRSTTPQQEVVRAATGQNLLKHQIGLFIFDRSQDQKNNIQNMILGKFVGVVQASDKSFEVYGLGSGLAFQPGVINQLNENNGAYTVTLATDENQFEGKLPQTLLVTDFATTLAYVNGLSNLPAILNMNVLAAAAAGSTSFTITGKGYFGGGVASAVTTVKWVNQSTLVKTTQSAVTVSSDTVMTFASVALTAGNYKLEITTSKGVALSPLNVVVT